MNDDGKPLLEHLTDWLAMLGVRFRAVLASPILDEKAGTEAEQVRDPDFEGWLHNDPMVTGNPASRYGDDAPGYLTGNGFGSLEIGTADD